MTEPEFLKHIGTRKRVKFVGGEWHGESKMLRSPINPISEIAKPSKYLGNNQWDSSVGGIEYDTYHLREFEDNLYYVHESWVDGWPGNINDEYETSNHRKIREERERGGPRDLISDGVIGHSPEVAEAFKKQIDDLNMDEQTISRSYVIPEDELARRDFDIYGIAFMIDGKRVDPHRVKMMVNTKKPLTLSLEDIIDR